jgi:hypothetical protein
MDVDLAPETLLHLLEEKILDVIASGQIGRENEDRAPADQQNSNQGDSDTSSNHSSSLDQSSSVGTPHHFCEYAILPNHPHEIYEVCVLTGNFPLRTVNIQQDEETVRQPTERLRIRPRQRCMSSNHRSSLTSTFFTRAALIGTRRIPGKSGCLGKLGAGEKRDYFSFPVGTR